MLRLNRGVVHADDFIFHLHQQLLERLLGRPTVFGRQCRKPSVLFEPAHPSAHILWWPGQKQVDAFFGQQDGAQELPRLRLRQTRLLQVGQVVERCEQIR